MRLLRINGTNVDIDEKTALGITLQSYDVKEPGKTFINISNTFSIPLTSHNSQIFGNVQDPQSISTKAYDELICNYWQDNEQMLVNSKVRIESIDERIDLFAFNKPSIWDILKGVLWPDFLADFIIWMQVNNGLPSESSPYTGADADFAAIYANNTEGLFLPMYFGNLYNFIEDGDTEPEENETTILLNAFDDGFMPGGGHFCIYAKTIFEYIEDTYDVNFLTSGGVLPGNIWDDPIANQMYIPAKEIFIEFTAGFEIYFRPMESNQIRTFSPLREQRDKADKNLYEFVNSFFQEFNILIDNLLVDGDNVIRAARFGDLENTADVVNWSGKLSGKPKFKPAINNYAQNNLIKFKEIFPEGDSLINSKTLTSLNKNIDFEKDLIEIDAYVSGVIPITGGVALDMSLKESFKTFVFMVSDGLTDDNIDVLGFDFPFTASRNFGNLQLQKAALYSLDGEYNFLDEVITYPRFYEIEKWLTLSDIRNFQFFRQYFIQELGGSFFVNKISGFNPDKALKPTKIELIKISNKTPITPPNLNVWVDGVDDPWTDGESDWWI